MRLHGFSVRGLVGVVLVGLMVGAAWGQHHPPSICDDGTDLTCGTDPPQCTTDEVLAVQNGCWVCVNPITCLPWGQAECVDNSDCPDGYVCDGCGTASCPACADCLGACFPNAWQCEPEVCDGFDNDCDGMVDEDEYWVVLSEVCYDGPPATMNVGICHAGVHYCVDGQWGPCEGQQLPESEICDEIDHDCDGQYANGVGAYPTTCGLGECAATGELICMLEGWTDTCVPGEPEPEVCDGKDNDCDGEIDQGCWDSDGDDVPDTADNCPQTYNPDQADTDEDGLGDLCDAAPGGCVKCADLNCDGDVNLADLAIFAHQWLEPCPCTPDCAGKECGDDGCGGSCGACAPGEFCSDGSCVECLTAAHCDDGSVCTTDSCFSGQCSYENILCSDDDECTDDYCDPAVGCVHPPVPDGTACAGGTCLGGECCMPDCAGKECGDDGCGGSCGACPPGWVCEDGMCLECSNDGHCDDGDVCTFDTCSSGQCSYQTIECDDGNPCTYNMCDPAFGCSHPPKPYGTSCAEDVPAVCMDGLCTPLY